MASAWYHVTEGQGQEVSKVVEWQDNVEVGKRCGILAYAPYPALV
jgi:hypothetical protein